MSVLATLPGVELLKAARGSLTAFQLACDERPHLLIMDASLPTEEGLLMVTQIKKEQIPIYCIAMVPTARQKEMVQAAGVDAVIFQSGSVRQLEMAVQTGRKCILENSEHQQD